MQSCSGESRPDVERRRRQRSPTIARVIDVDHLECLGVGEEGHDAVFACPVAGRSIGPSIVRAVSRSVRTSQTRTRRRRPPLVSRSARRSATSIRATRIGEYPPCISMPRAMRRSTAAAAVELASSRTRRSAPPIVTSRVPDSVTPRPDPSRRARASIARPVATPLSRSRLDDVAPVTTAVHRADRLRDGEPRARTAEATTPRSPRPTTRRRRWTPSTAAIARSPLVTISPVGRHGDRDVRRVLGHLVRAQDPACGRVDRSTTYRRDDRDQELPGRRERDGRGDAVRCRLRPDVRRRSAWLRRSRRRRRSRRARRSRSATATAPPSSRHGERTRARLEALRAEEEARPTRRRRRRARGHRSSRTSVNPLALTADRPEHGGGRAVGAHARRSATAPERSRCSAGGRTPGSRLPVCEVEDARVPVAGRA